MSRISLAKQLGGDRLEAAADALLNDVIGTKRYGGTREADYVFPDDQLNLGNVDEAITRLGARTPAKLTYGGDGSITGITGGNVIRNKKGGINIAKARSPKGRDDGTYRP